MLLRFAPENEDQVDEGGREASACWFAIHSDGRQVGSGVAHLAREWVECGAEDGLAKVRQVATRTVEVVLQLAMEAVAMVQRSLYKHLEAPRESRHLVAAGIHLNTTGTGAKVNTDPSIHSNLPPTLLLRGSFGCNPSNVVIHPQSCDKSLICI